MNTNVPQDKPESHPIPYPLRIGTFAVLRANGVIAHIERSPTLDEIRRILGGEIGNTIDIQGGHELHTASSDTSRNLRFNHAATTLAAMLTGMRDDILGDVVLVRGVAQKRNGL